VLQPFVGLLEGGPRDADRGVLARLRLFGHRRVRLPRHALPGAGRRLPVRRLLFGRIWALSAAGPSVQSPRLLLDSSRSISSFGQGDDGTLYLTDIDSGEVYRVVAAFR
jgi:hypothetical protein